MEFQNFFDTFSQIVAFPSSSISPHRSIFFSKIVLTVLYAYNIVMLTKCKRTFTKTSACIPGSRFPQIENRPIEADQFWHFGINFFQPFFTFWAFLSNLSFSFKLHKGTCTNHPSKVRLFYVKYMSWWVSKTLKFYAYSNNVNEKLMKNAPGKRSHSQK